MLKSVLIAGGVGAVIVVLLGNVITSTSQQIFPTNTMLATAGVGFGIGAGVQITVRLLGIS